MNLPKKIKVKNVVYTIEYTDKKLETQDTGFCFGYIYYIEKKILIYTKNRTKVDILETLLHEILHAILEKNQALSLLVLNQEEFISTLSTDLTQVLADNELCIKK